jgi:hypothetical protein
MKTETVLSGAERHRKTQNRKQLPTNHSGKTGCLSMVINQRQQLTAATDWEPCQAKHRNTKPRIHNIDYIECPPQLTP